MKLVDRILNLPLWILVLFVFVYALGIRCYYQTQKENLSMDELTNISIVCDRGEGWTKPYDSHRVYRGCELRTMLYEDGNSWQEVKHDLSKLWRDNKDHTHASLYYMILRVCYGTTHNLQTYISTAFVFNLACFIVAFFSLFLLLKAALGKHKWWIAFGLITLFWNTYSINTTLYLREYQMSVALYSVLMLLVYHLLVRIREGRDNHSSAIGSYFSFSLFMALVLSSGYLNFFYVGFCGLLLLYFAVKKKQYTTCLYLFLSAFGALLLCLLMYPGFFLILQDKSGSFSSQDSVMNLMAGDHILSNLRMKLWHFFLVYGRELVYFICFPLLAGLYIGLMRYKWRSLFKTSSFSLLLFTNFIASIVSFYLAPWADGLYLATSTAIVPLLLLYSFTKIDSTRWRRGGLLFIGIFYLAMSLCESNIYNLNKNWSYREWMTEEKPVVIASRRWEPYFLIPYFRDNQKVIITTSPEECKQLLSNIHEDVYLFDAFKKKYNTPVLNNQLLLKFKVIRSCNYTEWFEGFELERR